LRPLITRAPHTVPHTILRYVTFVAAAIRKVREFPSANLSGVEIRGNPVGNVRGNPPVGFQGVSTRFYLIPHNFRVSGVESGNPFSHPSAGRKLPLFPPARPPRSGRTHMPAPFVYAYSCYDYHMRRWKWGILALVLVGGIIASTMKITYVRFESGRGYWAIDFVLPWHR
jgi:hypothetical protein